MEKILFHNHGISAGILKKKPVNSFLASIFKNESIDFERISFIFCKDHYLLALNQKYLNHDTLTDILTFTLSGISRPIISEIYISIERVRENATTRSISYISELLRVMIHGILHLCGYSDHTQQKKAVMRKKEDYYLKEFESYLVRFT